jgi:hypothetical protein
MAATARSDAYGALVRKIGYSVGLEYLTPRVADLADVYVARGRVDGADWRELVTRWKRPKAEQHIADVYAQLELIRRDGNRIEVLPSLDVLSIILSGNNPLDDSQIICELDAVRFVLLFKILEADGDIFLNALANGFKPAALGDALQEMIRTKRTAVAPLFKQAASIRRAMDAISIRNQTEATTLGKRQTYAERSRQLRAVQPHIAQGAESWTDQRLPISQDYLEKACITRRAWAEELGLFDRDRSTISPRGEKLLWTLAQRGLSNEGEGVKHFAFWPYGYMLRSIGILPEAISVPDLTPADALGILVTSWEQESESKAIQPLSRPQILHLLSQIKIRYQNASLRGAIRHDLPLFIAEPVLSYWAMHARTRIEDFRAFLRDELQRSDRKLDFVMIRGTEGGLRLIKGD